MRGKVSCPRKQHRGGDWASNHRPSDLKSNTLTTTPPRPHAFYTIKIKNYAIKSNHFKKLLKTNLPL